MVGEQLKLSVFNEYGDPGDAELDQRGGTIPQALLRMNGQVTRELVKTSPFSAAGRIMALSGSNEQLIENCFLVCLSRRPTAGERTHFLKQLDDAPELQRDEITQDLYWASFNSPEFSWAH